MGLREKGWAGKDWIGLTEGRGQCKHGNVPSDFIKCCEVLE
jgi:hypothetical protein